MRPLFAALPAWGCRALLVLGLAAAALASCVAPEQVDSPQPLGLVPLDEAHGAEEEGRCFPLDPREERRNPAEREKSLIQQSSARSSVFAEEETPLPRASAPLLQARQEPGVMNAPTRGGAAAQRTATPPAGAATQRRGVPPAALALDAANAPGSADAAPGAATQRRPAPPAALALDAANAPGSAAAPPGAAAALGAGVGGREPAAGEAAVPPAPHGYNGSVLDRWVTAGRQKALAGLALLGLAEAVTVPRPAVATAGAATAANGSAPEAGARGRPMALLAAWAGEGRQSLLAVGEKLASRVRLAARTGSITQFGVGTDLILLALPVMVLICCMLGFSNGSPQALPSDLAAGLARRSSLLRPGRSEPLQPPPISSRRTSVGVPEVVQNLRKGPETPEGQRCLNGRLSRDPFMDAVGRSRANSAISVRTPVNTAGTSEGVLPEPAKQQQQYAGELRAHPLCPSLLVPEGCECTLHVPKLQPGFFSDGRQLAISDPNGSPVMRVAFLSGRRNTTVAGEGSRLVLSDLAGEVLAFCQDEAKSPASAQSLSIHAPQGVFATFRRMAGGHEVVGRRDWRLNLVQKTLAGGSGIAVLDEAGALLAVCEPPGERDPSTQTARIDANVDAGLVVLSLLCVDALGAQRSEDQSRRSSRGGGCDR